MATPHPVSASGEFDLQTMDEVDLVRLWLDGCSRSFEVLVNRYRPRLLRALVARCNGSIPDAEDITQEALTCAFQQRQKFDRRYRFSTWLYKIAFRLATNHGRRRRRIFWTSFDEHHPPITPKNETHLVESMDRMENLWLTIRRHLSPDQYSAVWLRYGEELTVAEIGRVMQKTQIGVRVLLHRARLRLAESLATSSWMNERGD